VALTERLALLVDARVDGAVRDIKTLAKESGRTDDQAKKLEHRGKAIGTAWKVGVGVVAGAALVKLAQLSGQAIEDASALAETTNKVGVVFEDQAGKVLKFGETAAESLGQSKQQALGAAATFGQFFDAAGMANDAAADMSLTMVGLASDMASFNDADPSEVLQNLRSGLSGEAEPLRKFGVFLNEGAVAAKAAELGLVGLNGKLSDGQKIQARYAIIMEQTAKAQGDFARTSDGLANKQRQATALMADASAELGEGLLPAQLALTNALVDAAPAISAVAKGTANLIEGFVGLPGPVKAVAGGVTVAAAGFLVLAPRINEARKLLTDLSVSSPKAAKGLGMVGKAAGAVGAIIALDFALKGLNSTMEHSATGGEQLTTTVLDLADGKVSTLGKDFNDLAKNLEEIGTGGLFDVFDKADSIMVLSDGLEVLNNVLPGEQAQQQMREFKGQLEAIDGVLSGLVSSGGPEDAKAAFDAIATSMNLSATGIEELKAGLPGYAEALAGASNATRLSTGATDDHTDATDENTKALAANIDAMREKRSEAIRAMNAEINYQASIDDARASLKENGKTLDLETEKGRANKSALLGMAAAWNDLSDKEKNSQGARAAAIKQFVDLATKMGMSEGKARALARSILEIPSKRVEVTADTSAAQAAVNRFITDNNGRTVRINIDGSRTAGGLTGKAIGGPVNAGETYLVGERGPELFTPRQSGSITPNSALVRATGGGGGRMVDNSVATYAKSLAKASLITEKHAAILLKSADQIRDGIRAKIKSLVEERAQVASSFASSFGQTVFGSDATSIEGILGLAGQQASQAVDVKTAISALIDKGVSESVLQDLAASGQSGWDQIKALAGADKTQLAEFNKLTQVANSNLLAAGNMVGGALLNDDIAAAKAIERVADRLADRLEKALAKKDKDTVIHFHLGAKEIRQTLLELKRKSREPLGLS